MSDRTALLVIAKTPVPGRVKTRLVPPLDAVQACEVAWACLLDTLDVAAATPAARHVLVLDGEPGPWVPPDFTVIAQRSGDLADRLTGAFEDTFAAFAPDVEAALVIAMDTPQVTVAILTEALTQLAGGTPAVLGPASDGGFWTIGLRADHAEPAAVFTAIPMSTSRTGAAQHERLVALGLAPRTLVELRDLDEVDDLAHLAALGPPRLAAVHARLQQADALSVPTPEFHPCPSSS